MYTIDLLKGDGIPIRSRPGGIALACLIVVVPLLAGLGVVSFHLDCNVVIAIQKQQLKKLEAAIGTLSEAVQKKETLEQEKRLANRMLGDVGTALTGYQQWSSVLTDLVAGLSDTLVLTRLEVKRDTVRRKVAAKDHPTKTVEAGVPIRTLRIGVCETSPGASAEAVKNLQTHLRSSPTLGPILDTITVSRDSTMLDGREAVRYELQCACKPADP